MDIVNSQMVILIPNHIPEVALMLLEQLKPFSDLTKKRKYIRVYKTQIVEVNWPPDQCSLLKFVEILLRKPSFYVTGSEMKIDKTS